MTDEILLQIGQLFITFLSSASGIACIFYLISWVATLFLSFVFPRRYGG